MERHKLKVAVYILLIKNNQILLGRRFNTGWQDGNYGLPAGHLEKDETIMEGAIREVKEEAGVIVKERDLKYIHTMHRMNIYMDIFFTATEWEGEPKIGEKDKCDDLCWFPLDQLPENIIPSIKHAINQYKNQVYFSEFNPESDK